MRAIGVDARLKPHPGVAVFSIGKAFGDFQFHRVATCHGDVNLARTFFDGLADGKAAHIGNGCAMTDYVQFRRRFHHPLFHRPARDIDAAFWF